MRVKLTFRNLSMRDAQKLCKYSKDRGITDSKHDIEVEGLNPFASDMTLADIEKVKVCPDCEDRVMRLVFWNLLAHVSPQQPILVVYQCEECKRVEIDVE